MDQRPSPGDLCLDHVAHFVPDLDAAAHDLEKLGFVVTPESAHRTQHGPAGTSNRCLMLEAGYVEILAPTMDTPNAAAGASDEALRRRASAAASARPSRRRSIRGSPRMASSPSRFNLARNLQDGTPVRFNVVYVPPAKMPEGRIQYCEHLTQAEMWRESWVNRGLRLDAAFVVAEDPAEVAARWARYTGVLPRRDGDFVELPLARGKVIIGSRAALVRLLGEAPPAPALAGYALSTGKRGEKRRVVKLPPSLGGVWVIS
jgi:hypothetical protein